LANQPVQRKLAAILAADVVGFSSLMERDEEGSYARVGRLRREVIEPCLSEQRGRLIKTTGDGFLAEFASSIAALRCTIAIQGDLSNDPGVFGSQRRLCPGQLALIPRHSPLGRWDRIHLILHGHTPRLGYRGREECDTVIGIRSVFGPKGTSRPAQWQTTCLIHKRHRSKAKAKATTGNRRQRIATDQSRYRDSSVPR